MGRDVLHDDQGVQDCESSMNYPWEHDVHIQSG